MVNFNHELEFYWVSVGLPTVGGGARGGGPSANRRVSNKILLHPYITRVPGDGAFGVSPLTDRGPVVLNGTLDQLKSTGPPPVGWLVAPKGGQGQIMI